MWNQGDNSDAGGGFLKSDAGSGAAGRSNRGVRNTVSVSVDQVIKLTTKEHQLVIHRQPVNTVCLVGRVEGVNESTTKTVYTINDHTNEPIEVILWHGNKDENGDGAGPSTTNNGRTKAPIIMENTYVKIFGQARFNRPKPNIVVFKIIPILDLNDITAHGLQIMHDCLVLQKRKNNALAGAPAGSQIITSEPDVQMKDDSMIGGLTELQKLIHGIVKKDSTWEGVAVDAICGAIKGVDQKKIRDALDFLCNEGHLYTSLDDDHFKTTD